jgi:membrane-associated phospholipid phosphatase
LRVVAEWRLKLLLLVGLTAAFCGPYLLLTHHAVRPVRDLPLTALDRWAGFDPRWVWAYLSLYLLNPTLPWLATSRAQLQRYVVGFAWLAGVCFVIYLLMPVRAPRPAVYPSTGMYALLRQLDGPYNALPSLHAGFIYFTLAFARRVYGPVRPAVVAFFLGWGAVIIWATLATKQHYAVDLLAGIVVAAACDAVAWRRSRRSVGEKSHAGFR